MDESKLLRIVQKIVDRQVLLREKELEKIDSSFWEFPGIALEFYFKPNVSNSLKDEIMDDTWRLVYDYIGLPVSLIDRTKKVVKENRENLDVKGLIEKFMETTDFEGVCGFWIDDEVENYWVYIIIDSNLLKRISLYDKVMVKKIQNEVKNKIKLWLGIDVMIGSILKNCEEI